MILYFANRQMNICGTASTELPRGLTIVEDKKAEDVDTGVASFEGRIVFDAESRKLAENCVKVGNYLLRSFNGENQFFTIIDSEADTKNQEVYFYAEDAGLDLLNEICLPYEADKAYPISHYIEKFAYDSGFVIGTNEATDLTRKLSWDGESTATERLASVATQFDNCEISFSFEIKGLQVVKKLINIYKERGTDTGVQLRLNKEVDRIVSKESIKNLATALKVTGGTPEDGEVPINLNGYTYDDGDIFLEGTYLKSRSAHSAWSRYLAEDGDYTGHIMRTFTYDTTSQSELCNRAVAELRKISKIEANYEADVSELPNHIRVGDRVSIVDDAGELYISTRILKLEESATSESRKATFGEFLIKDSGIDEDVARLAAQFAKSSTSAARALTIAKDAKAQAVSAREQANTALDGAVQAQQVADNAKAVADAATESATNATAKANAAEQAVGEVKEDVASIEKTVDDANAAAEQARQAAATAEIKATEAQTAAIEAKEDAADAKEQAGVAKTNSETAISKADGAKTTAEQAIEDATEAKTTAEAAKIDAEQAEKDVAALGENLTTLSNTMTAEYARKTELTETEASLQSQISQNAGQIQSVVTQVTTIDETANNAAEQAAQAQETAAAAQQQADKATEDAEAAQTAADAAALAATNAQSEADKAKAAAATAQGVADKAEEDLAAAKADLATVQSRVDATEEDIATAQQAVETAQAAADKAKADAADATAKANAAQGTADTAVANAATAQTKANEAAQAAALAQQTADGAKGDAAAAKQAADDAAAAARTAQQTADTAKTNAETAQSKANEAAAAATAAQTAADNADAKAQQAAADLAAAEQNLADVTSRVDATEEEVEAAQAAVVTAQAKADEANAAAVAAQSTADTAKADAEKAQTDADNAKKAADDAQAAAEAAQKAADDAQDAVDALAIRVTKTETDIVQTSEQIKLLATKEEVAQTLGGYYTSEQTDAQINLKADEITSTVNSRIEGIDIGGRNLLLGTRDFNITNNRWTGWINPSSYTITEDDDGFSVASIASSNLTEPGYKSFYSNVVKAETGDVFTISCWFKVDDVSLLDNQKVYIFETFTEDGNRVAWDDCSLSRATTEELTNGKWVRLVSHHTVSYEGENLNCGLRLCLFQNGSIHFKKCKMELGNKPTDWTPAPEDMATVEEMGLLADRVTEAETAIEQNAESITLRATKTELNAVDTKATNAKNTADGVADNLAENYYNKTQTEAKIKVEADNIASVVKTVGEQGERISTVEQTASSFTVELGKTNNAVAAAAATATNFLYFDDTNGLFIGNKSNGSWTGYRAQLASNAFNIRNENGKRLASYGASEISFYDGNDTKIASFKSDEISLGMGNVDAKVSFCNDAAVISYSTKYEAVGIASEGFYIKTSGKGVSLSETETIGDYTYQSALELLGHYGASFAYSKTDSAGTVLDLCGLSFYGSDVNINSKSGSVKIIAPIVNVTGDFGVDGDVTINENFCMEFGSGDVYPVITLLNSREDIAIGYNRYNSSLGRTYLTAGTNIYLRAKDFMAFFPNEGDLNSNGTSNAPKAIIFGNAGNGHPLIRPNSTGYGYVGGANYKFSAFYAVNGTIQTSDRNQKENILDIGEKYEELFKRLRPVTYKLKGKEHDRVHVGFIAQEVEEAMAEVGLTADDFAALCIDDKIEYDEETGEERIILDEKGEPVKLYSLRYKEFDGLYAHMIQKLMKEVASLKDEISEMKGTKTA